MALKTLSPRDSHQGFTLIELLVVIAIIGVLSTLAIIALGSARSKSRDSKRVADMQSLHKALEIYFADNSSYPTLITPGLPLKSPDGSVTYLSSIPSNPSPRADGNCANDNYTYGGSADGKNYILNFCLGSATGNLSAGLQTTSNEGGVGADPSLILWYKFDEGTGTAITDSSGRAHSATTFNTPTWQSGANCKVGGCLELPNSGTSYVRTNASYAFESQAQQALTIASWVYYISRSGGATLLSEGFQATGQPFVLWFEDANSRFQYMDGTGSYGNTLTTALATASAWTHIAVVADYDNKTVKFYKNGALQATNNISTVMAFPSVARFKYIGAYLAGTDFFFGRLDDYRVYNRALSTNEIKAIYDASN